MKILYSVTSDESLLVELVGEMDAAGCADIRPTLEQLLEDAAEKNILLDLGQVSFIDSSGIGAIVFLFKRLKSKGQSLELTNVSGQPRELIELLRIDTAIPVGFKMMEKQVCAH